MKDVTLYIQAINISIPTLLRENNTPLLKRSNTKYIKAFITSVNRVRLWLGAYSLAEITTADRNRISQDAWEGTRSQHTKTLWTYQEKPRKKELLSMEMIPHRQFSKDKTSTSKSNNSRLNPNDTTYNMEQRHSVVQKKMDKFLLTIKTINMATKRNKLERIQASTTLKTKTEQSFISSKTIL